MYKKQIKGFAMGKEMLYATGGIYEKSGFHYLCGPDNALLKYAARVRSQRGTPA
jgi:hypothetical protein